SRSCKAGGEERLAVGGEDVDVLSGGCGQRGCAGREVVVDAVLDGGGQRAKGEFLMAHGDAVGIDADGCFVVGVPIVGGAVGGGTVCKADGVGSRAVGGGENVDGCGIGGSGEAEGGDDLGDFGSGG